jgi:NitT/TauT family transport system substrate-binding protein
MSKARFFIFGFVAIMVLAFGSAAYAATKVTYADFRISYNSAAYVAKSKGFFKAEGIDLDVQRIKSGKFSAIFLSTKQAEIALLNAKDMLGLRKNGKNMKWIYGVSNRMTMDFVMNKGVADRLGLSRKIPLMARYKGLKGLKIGITRRGAVTDLYTRYYLKKAGLDPDRDATIIPIGGGTNLLAALRTGQIDGFMLSPPRPGTAVRGGFGKIIIKSTSGDVPEFKSYAYSMYAVREGWLKDNGNTVRAYIRALKKGVNFLHDNLDESVDLLKKNWFKKAKKVVLKDTLKDFLPALPRDGKLRKTAIANMVNTMHAGGVLKEKLDLREGHLWTNEYNK